MTFPGRVVGRHWVLGTFILTALSIAPPVSAQAQFELLKSFSSDGSEGVGPAGPMVQAHDGWIYGLTAWSSSVSSCGTAFRFHPTDPVGTFQTVWRSGGQGGPGCYVNEGGLVLAGDGNMYFPTQDGGDCNAGRVFRLSPPGIVQPVIDRFMRLEVVGSNFQCLPRPETTLNRPAFGLSVGADGALYGVAYGGGAHGRGGIYRVGLDGALSEVVSFPAGHGGQQDPVTMGTDGKLYGASMNSPLPSFVFRADPLSASVQRLFEFPTTTAIDGAVPRGRLIEVPPTPGEDIAFVGVTQQGGTGGAGVIYRIGVAGDTASFSKLHQFAVSGTYLGETPAAGLIRGPDGALYGTTAGYAGFLGPAYVGPGTPASGELGTVYRLGSDGLVTKLFGGGIQPFASLLLATDGNLYGTSYTGSVPSGAIFRVTLPRPENRPPLAASDTLQAVEDTAANGQFHATDDDGDSLTYTLVSNASKGMVTLTDPATGAFTYTPNANANGPDSFTFKANDGTVDSDVATVVIGIEPLNDDPVAMSIDALSTPEDAAVSGTLSAADVDGDALTYSIVANGTIGSAVVTNASTGAFTYTPNPNASGQDSFSFKANDGLVNSNLVTVTITVVPVNDPPGASDGALSVTAGDSASGTLVASDIDSPTLARTIVQNGSKGTAVITNPTTGEFTYTANAGATGTDTFTFKANDDALDSNVAMVTVTIQASTCAAATNVTSRLYIRLDQARRNRTTGRFSQRVRIENRSGGAVGGPVSYVLDGLTAGTTVVGSAGITTCAVPAGSPFITLNVGSDGVLSNRERVEFVLDLINGGATAVTHTPRVLAGAGAR